MKLYSLIILLSMIVVSTAGQSFDGEILGGVDNGFQNNEGVSVTLLSTQDSVIRRTFTKRDGSFAFQRLDNGFYKLSITMIGFEKYSSDTIEITEENGQRVLPKVTLTPVSLVLKEVSVSGQQPLLEQKIDRTVINVGALISNVGSNALELLERLPGVIVEDNGKINLNGKSGVLVLIDNKPTYLSTLDLLTLLKSLPSASIDLIELITNPPAKYDAAGNGGIINIKTERSKIIGLYASLSLSYARAFYNRHNENVAFNYNNKKLNLFGNFGYSYTHTYRKLEVDRDYFTNNSILSSSFSQTSLYTPKTQSPSTRIGLDYHLSPKSIIGMLFNAGTSILKDTVLTNSYLHNNAGSIDSSLIANNHNEKVLWNKGFNLNYKYSFDKIANEISVDVDYIRYDSDINQSFLNNIYNANGTFRNRDNITADLPSNIDIYSFKIDYTNKLPNKIRMDAGVKTSLVLTENSANYYNNTGQVNVIDYTKTNRFLYEEGISAGYLNLNKELRRFAFQTGLRLERTHGKGHQLGNAIQADSSFNNIYTNLFPTAYVSYKLDSVGGHRLSLLYGKRINRPSYQSLNPFIFLIDKFTYSTGNPFLKPEFTHNLEFTYNFKSIIAASIKYNYSNNVHIESFQSVDGVLVNKSSNIGKRTLLTYSVNASIRPLKGWSANIYSEVVNTEFDGLIYGKQLNTSSINWLLNPYTQVRLKDGWSFELNGYYLTKRVNAQFQQSAQWQMGGGIKKSLYKDKATIRLNASDIFNSLKPGGLITNIPNTLARFRNYRDTRSVTVTFSYSVGKATARRNSDGAEDEKNRVKY